MINPIALNLRPEVLEALGITPNSETFKMNGQRHDERQVANTIKRGGRPRHSATKQRSKDTTGHRQMSKYAAQRVATRSMTTTTSAERPAPQGLTREQLLYTEKYHKGPVFDRNTGRPYK